MAISTKSKTIKKSSVKPVEQPVKPVVEKPVEQEEKHDGRKKPVFQLFYNLEASTSVPLSSLVSLAKTPIKGAKYAVRDIHPDHVQHLAIAYQNNEPLPPLLVVQSSWGNVLIDGYHRTKALESNLEASTDKDNLEKARNDAMVQVTFFTSVVERDVVNKAFEANRTNGLAWSDKSRSRYAIWLMEDSKEQGNELSMRQAASMANVSAAAVSKQIARDKKKAGEDVETADKVKPAIKRLFSAIETIVGGADNLVSQLQVFVTHDNFENIQTIANALLNVKQPTE